MGHFDRYEPGQQVDSYRIDRAVAHSGMATIYQATDNRDGRIVALKVPHPDMEADPILFDRFKREAGIGEKLNHPKVMRVFGDEKRSRIYMVMELSLIHILLSKDKAFKYARIAKFIVGWGSHLYYWVYPGVMVATTGVFVGYIVGFFFPTFISGANPGPVFMGLVAVLFSFFVAWIAAKGAGASTAVNLAINVVQISALVVFSVLALGYRSTHPEGATGPTAFQYDSTTLSTYTYQFAMAKDGTTILRDKDQNPLPLLDSAGKPVPFVISYQQTDASGNFLAHPNALSVISPHKFSYLFIQATVAILILVGFESVTSMGGEAKNPTKHIPIAVIASLLIQGLVCYLFEYFAANYFLNSGYTMQSAAGSAAPIGDMMIIVGDWLLGPGHGKYFMMVEALTVFLAPVSYTHLDVYKRQNIMRFK